MANIFFFFNKSQTKDTLTETRLLRLHVSSFCYAFYDTLVRNS